MAYFPHIPRDLFKDLISCHLASSPRPGFPYAIVCGLVGPSAHRREALLSTLRHPGPFISMHLAWVLLLCLPWKGWFSWVCSFSSSPPALSPVIGDATCQRH